MPQTDLRPTFARLVVAVALITALLPATGAAQDADEAWKQSLVTNLRGVGDKIVALAAAIDAEKFTWKPTPEVRSVSQVFMHTVGTNLQLPALLGAEAPEGYEIPDSGPYALGVQRAHWEAEVIEKAAVVDILRDSFDYATSAVLAIDDLDEEVAPFGFKASKRDYLLLLVAHANEHLGQSIAYARGAGVVPPWSQGAERARPASTAAFENGLARGEIIAIDRFGNLETSFVGDDLDQLGIQIGDHLALAAGGGHIEVFVGTTFTDVQMGEWVAFLSLSGRLLVGRNYASAANSLEVSIGDSVTIQPAGSAH